MKNWLFKIILIMSIIIPWSNALTSLFILPLGLFYFYDVTINGVKRKYLIHVLIIGSIFIVNLFFGLINENIFENLRVVLKQSPLLILPVLVLTSGQKLTKLEVSKILLAFSISVIVMACFNYCFAFSIIFSENHEVIPTLEDIRYDVFSRGLINHHQLYFGLYISFATIVFFYYLLRSGKRISRVILGIALFFSFYFLVALSVRMSLVSTMLGALIIILTSRIASMLKIIAIGMFSLTGILVYQLNSTLKKRIDYLWEFSFDYDYQKDWAYEGLALRFMNWECSLSTGLNNVFTGVGTSNVQEKLNDCYLENRFESILYFTRTYQKPFNSHNFYLQTFVASGIIGLLVSFIMAFYFFIYSVKSRNKLLFLFLFLFCLQGLTESLLYREKGIYFFSLFCSVLLLYPDSRVLKEGIINSNK